MKLYDNPLSPYALKLRVILYEKGLPFDKHEITPRRNAKSYSA
jgi:glutathione S-transferase